MRRQLIASTLAGFILVPAAAQAGGFHINFGWSDHHNSVQFGIGHGGVGVGVNLGPRHYHRAPVVVPVPVPTRCWIPGHYEERVDYEYVAGQWRSEWVPPVVERVQCFGIWETRMVRPGYWRSVWVPPRTIPRTVRVWVPGCWR